MNHQIALGQIWRNASANTLVKIIQVDDEKVRLTNDINAETFTDKQCYWLGIENFRNKFELTNFGRETDLESLIRRLKVCETYCALGNDLDGRERREMVQTIEEACKNISDMVAENKKLKDDNLSYAAGIKMATQALSGTNRLHEVILDERDEAKAEAQADKVDLEFLRKNQQESYAKINLLTADNKELQRKYEDAVLWRNDYADKCKKAETEIGDLDRQIRSLKTQHQAAITALETKHFSQMTKLERITTNATKLASEDARRFIDECFSDKEY